MLATDVDIIGIVFAGVDETVTARAIFYQSQIQLKQIEVLIPYCIAAYYGTAFVGRNDLVCDRDEISHICIALAHLHTVQIAVGLANQSNDVQRRLPFQLFHIGQ